jgi:hypothetical protein
MVVLPIGVGRRNPSQKADDSRSWAPQCNPASSYRIDELYMASVVFSMLTA